MALDRPVAPSPAYPGLHARFAPSFAEIAKGSLARELDGELPYEPVRLLKEAGFGAIRVPIEYGGLGGTLPDLVQLWVELAAADANLAQALRGHAAFAEDRLWQHARGADQSVWFERFVRGEIAGNAWSEVGATGIDTQQTVLTPVDDSVGADYLVNGEKYYTTGTIYAEWVDIYARRSGCAGDDDFVIAVASTEAAGLTIADDWSGFGQRGTGSGTTRFVDVPVAAEDVLPFVDRFPYQTSLYQLNLLATLCGIGRAALADVVDEVRVRCRNYSHANAPRVRDDAQVLGRVGEIGSAVYAAEAATLRAAGALQQVFDAAGGSPERIARTAEVAEVESSAAQVVVTDLVLGATTDLFDALGASATASHRGLDRHWRNARTVASHNPRLFKARVVGDFEVNGAAPPFAWAIGTTDPRRAWAGR